MDFDEYEYLEKTVKASAAPPANGSDGKDRGSRRRSSAGDGEDDGDGVRQWVAGTSGGVDPVRERRGRSGNGSGHRGADEVRRGGTRHRRRRGRGRGCLGRGPMGIDPDLDRIGRGEGDICARGR